jgi:primary-amine oxidase
VRVTVQPDSAPRSAHPLDPLSAAEIAQTTTILRRDRGVGPRWRIASIELLEPPKALSRTYAAGHPIERSAIAVAWDRETNLAVKAIVSLTGDAVRSWVPQPGRQPNATVDEWHECETAMLAHPRVLAALGSRGITDPSLVLVDMWTFGRHNIPPQWLERRVGWCDIWLRESPTANPYAHLVSGLKLIVDLNDMSLLDIEDSPAAPAAQVMGEYLPEHVRAPSIRGPLAPLEITQPAGVSFELNGYELRWQGWTMRLGFNYREGLVLHRVSYTEMVVPYRDASVDHARRTAFDIGEWGLGFMTTSLELGCDCLGEIRYVDAVLHDTAGDPYTIANAICLHEEDNAVLWKHVDPRAGAEVRRMRRMVVSTHMTVANYEYLVYWRFYQDGSIECEVRATGILVTTPFAGDQPPATGVVVDTQTYAPIHQHFIVARLDMEVDGDRNTVVMSETAMPPIGPDNPEGMALVQRSVPLRTEAEGKQDYDWSTQRSWKVTNPHRLNHVGTPVSYKLAPTSAFPAMMDPAAPAFRRAQVIGHTLWITPFAADERWPSGEFVNQSGEDEGLPAWTAANRGIEDADVVLWYVFGIHHVPRIEDWPVMPADTVSFWLKPVGFFDRNPALDVAPSPSSHACGCPPGECHCH